MTKRQVGLILGVVILTAGCVPANTEVLSSEEAVETSALESAEETHEVSEKASDKESEASYKETEESLKAAEESLKAMEESLKAAEESLKAVEESMEAGKDNEYSMVVKEPEKYLKKQVQFSGTIIRSASVGSTSVQIVLAVNGDEENKAVGEYKRSIVDTSLVVGDEITLSGEFQGLIRYRMQTGGAESLPTINIEKIDNIVRAEPETQAAIPFSMPNPAETATSEPSIAPDPHAEEKGSDTGENITEEEPTVQKAPVISAGQEK
ncbi:MAG: hypothetical protein HFG54_12085 [Lachnospiraceae bacterium]|jgi:hypothetical protein|nr:hypothetical protein [Lachnospiraceae bacterium]